MRVMCMFMFFFFNDTATTEIYTLSLHDALPICRIPSARSLNAQPSSVSQPRTPASCRSEEHTSELQSRPHLVCRLLLEKKKKKTTTPNQTPQHHPRPHNYKHTNLIPNNHTLPPR